ncbi:maltotransferase domain-containing protein [Mycobacterium leprae]
MYPAKAVVGEMVPVSATVWREGHEAVPPHTGCPQPRVRCLLATKTHRIKVVQDLKARPAATPRSDESSCC